jgi:hypothetical protein
MGVKAQKATLQGGLSAQAVAEVIRLFIESCKDPVIMEPGDEPIAIQPGRYSLEPHAAGCLLHVWGDSGNVVRRVTAIEQQQRGRLDLRARTFGKGDITLSLVDRARRGPDLERGSRATRFREQLRRMLRRQFPDWNIESLTTSPDLEHTLSPVYTRGLLTAGQQAWAVIGASAHLDAASYDRLLTFGLIWLDFARRRDTRRIFRGLKIFLPDAHTQTTAHRLAYLNPAVCQCDLHAFSRGGDVKEIDPHDYGNLTTDLLPCLPLSEPAEPVAAWLNELRATPGVETVARPDGLLSVRVRGLPFALAGRGVMTAGLEQQLPVTETSFRRVLRLAQELSRFRSVDALDTQNPLFRRHPESWLESQVRLQFCVIDGNLLASPVYSQVPAVAGADRGIIDLLACDRWGRLALLELKASEDPHLPLQALDYWIRVRWHLRHESFRRNNYFPGVEIAKTSPRILLVSPAFDFHPTTETILRYFSPSVEVERVGVSAEWRRELKVVFRKAGAERLA